MVRRALVLFFAVCAGITPLGAGQNGRIEFPPASPESQGLVSADLDSLFTGYVFNERGFNTVGCNLLGSGKIDEAIAVFQWNAEAFPGSSNVWDSLAEAWMTKGDKEKASAYYKKSIELNPENENEKKKLEELAKKP